LVIAESLRTYLLAQCCRFYHFGIWCLDAEFRKREDSVDLSRKILALLLNKEVVDFTFPSYPSLGDPENVDWHENPFWKKLMLKCPRLEKIVLDEAYEYIYHTELPLFMNTLMSMKHLQVIELLQLWFNDSELSQLAEQMPNLR
jgi:hypothetical protein